MNRRITVSFLLVAATTATGFLGCIGAPDMNPIGLLKRGWSWQDIQSVGGIKIGKPRQEKNGDVFLPVECDVSGTREITTKPTMLNSAIVVHHVQARVKDHKIHLTIITTPTHGSLSCAANGANLGKLPPGDYEVIYDSPKDSEKALGKITL